MPDSTRSPPDGDNTLSTTPADLGHSVITAFWTPKPMIFSCRNLYPLRPNSLFVLVFTLLSLAQTAVAKTDYPHIVEDPPLSPQEQQKKFHLPPGFEIQLVA